MAPILWGLLILFAACALSAYWLALAISKLNSLQSRVLSFGPITFTTVGVAHEMQIKNKLKIDKVFFI